MISTPRNLIPLAFVVLLVQASWAIPRFPGHFSDHPQQRSNVRPEAIAVGGGAGGGGGSSSSSGAAPQGKSEGEIISEPSANIRAETIERSVPEHHGGAAEHAIEHSPAAAAAAHGHEGGSSGGLASGISGGSSSGGAKDIAIGGQHLAGSEESSPALLKQHGSEFEGAAGQSAAAAAPASDGHAHVNKKAHAEGHEGGAAPAAAAVAAAAAPEHEIEHHGAGGGIGAAGAAGRYLAAAAPEAGSDIGAAAGGQVSGGVEQQSISQLKKISAVGQQEAAGVAIGGVQSIAEEPAQGVQQQFDSVGRAFQLPEKTAQEGGEQVVGQEAVEPQAAVKKIGSVAEEKKHKRSESQQ